MGKCIKKMKSFERKDTWGSMIPEVLLLIADLLLFHDYVAFRGVCRSWRHVATKEHFSNKSFQQPPLLMLAEREEDKQSGSRNFYCLTTEKVRRVFLPEASGKWLMETLGWLVMMDATTLKLELFHPFSKIQVALPNLYNFDFTDPDEEDDNSLNVIHKAVLSASPSFTPDYTLVIICGRQHHLAFWRPGKQTWNHFVLPPTWFLDIVYYKNKFYAIDQWGRLYVLDLELQGYAGNLTLCALVPALNLRWGTFKYYLVESEGAFLIVYQTIFPHDDCDMDSGSKKFRIFEMDMDQSIIKEIDGLGSRAIFVGSNTSSSVDTCRFSAIKSNSVYYTDPLIFVNPPDLNINMSGEDRGVYYTDPLVYINPHNLTIKPSGEDMGIYGLADGKTERHHKDLCVRFTCPSIWVTPSF